MSTGVVKALPGKLEFKTHSPTILYCLFKCSDYVVVYALFIVAPMLCVGGVWSLFSGVVLGVLSSLTIILLR